MGYTEFNGYQNGSSGQYTIHLNCTYTSNGSSANTSNVYMTLSFMRSDYSSYWYNETGSAYVEFWCDGQYYKENFNINLNYNAGQWYQIGPGHTFVVPHNNNGTKSCEVRAYAYIGIAPDNVVVDAHTLTLDTIPRYANFTTGVDKKTMTSARVKWSADAHISEGQYYLDGKSTAVGITTNATSGSFTVKDLSPDTGHNVRIRLKRKDSGLWTEKTASFTTIAGASISSVPKWTLPDTSGNITLNISNPGSGYIRLVFYAKSASEGLLPVVTKTLSGTPSGKTAISFTEAEIEKFFAQAPNTADGQYCVYTYTYSSQANANNNTSHLSEHISPLVKFSVPNNSATKPSVTASMFDVYDDNNAYGYFTTADHHLFVQSLSNVIVKVTGAATEKKGASIPAKAYTVTFNSTSCSGMNVNDVHSFNSAPVANTYSVTLTVTDSRGFTSSASKNITVYQYFQPTGNITLERQNGFEAPTTLAFEGTYAVVNDQNTIKSLKYRYGETIAARDAASWTDITAQATISGGKVTVPKFNIGSFAINKAYEFQVQITDGYDTFEFSKTLTQGIPILSISDKGRVGVNCLPIDSATTNDTSTRLQVDGAVKAYSFNGMRGIATSLATNSDEYAASSKLTNSLNNSLTTLNSSFANHNHDSRYYTESEINTLVNNRVERSFGLTCSSVEDFVKAIKNGTMMGKVKDTSDWAGFGVNSWFKVIVVNQNLTGSDYDVDIFMIIKPSNGTNDVYIGRISGKTSYTFSKSKVLLYGDSSGGISQPANQQLYISASNETNYKLFLGVRDSSWGFGPNVSGMLTLGSPKYKWSSVYANNGTVQTSDKKEKHNVSPLDIKLSKAFIMNLNPVKYKMNTETTGKYHYGLIAQDVEETMFNLNLSENDFAGLCKIESETEPNQFSYGLIYSEFIAPIIKTIQSQEYEINRLKKEIEALKRIVL